MFMARENLLVFKNMIVDRLAVSALFLSQACLFDYMFNCKEKGGYFWIYFSFMKRQTYYTHVLVPQK